MSDNSIRKQIFNGSMSSFAGSDEASGVILYNLCHVIYYVIFHIIKLFL